MPRATPLPLDERRAALMAATQPLLERFGREVSTRQIAEAAGVAEGTIFRAFPTKEALIDACLEDAFDVQHICDALTELDRGLGFEEHVSAVVTALQERMRQVIALFHALRMAPPSPAQVGDLRARQARDNERLTAALAASLEPYADRLRHPTTEAADTLRILTFALTHPMLSGGSPQTPSRIADLALHGLAAPTVATQESLC